MADNLDTEQGLIYKDPETGIYKATEYLEDAWFQLIEAVGGEGSTSSGNDAFDLANLHQMLLTMPSKISNLKKEVEEIEQILASAVSDNSYLRQIVNNITSFKVKFTTVSTTINAFETLICNNSSSINVTLDLNANVNDVVNIKRNNAEVIVLGTIDGQVDMVLNVPKYSTKLVFNGTDWNRI